MRSGDDFICIADYPNTCPEDGARTELVEQYSDHSVEKCLKCGELYRFWEDEDLSNRF
jgi:hypothetical protein